MGQFDLQSNILRGVLQAIESQVPLFWHFHEGLKCIIIEVLHQELVHKCSLRCSTWPILDFWIYHCWVIWWAVKCRFSRCQKSSTKTFGHLYFEFWAINWQKDIKYVTWMQNFFVWKFYWSPTYGWLSNFQHCMGGG